MVFEGGKPVQRGQDHDAPQARGERPRRCTYEGAKDRLEDMGDEVGRRYERLSDDVRRGADRASTARRRYRETAEASEWVPQGQEGHGWLGR